MDLNLTNEIEEWILLQGATVTPANNLQLVDHQGKTQHSGVEVIFGHRKIHFYSVAQGENKMIRIFFNDETKSTALVIMMKWPNKIFKHNIPSEWV